MIRLRARSLLSCRSGVAMIEFALGAPFLLMAGLWGTETANLALVNMKIGQLAVHIADNASRIGDTSTLQDRMIYESDINDLIYGAQIQAGGIGLYDNGRVTLSSVEVNENGAQFIHWQRCRGAKRTHSNYGEEGDLLPAGIGPKRSEVIAEAGNAVIFVEISYTYQPLISDRFIPNREITSIAAFVVRDDRDLSQIYQRDAARPDPVQACRTHSGNVALGTSGAFN